MITCRVEYFLSNMNTLPYTLIDISYAHGLRKIQKITSRKFASLMALNTTNLNHAQTFNRQYLKNEANFLVR